MSSRFQQAETARKAPLGAVIPKMAGRFHGVKPGRHSCPPAAQAKKAIGLADILSASVSAQNKEYNKSAHPNDAHFLYW